MKINIEYEFIIYAKVIEEIRSHPTLKLNHYYEVVDFKLDKYDDFIYLRDEYGFLNENQVSDDFEFYLKIQDKLFKIKDLMESIFNKTEFEIDINSLIPLYQNEEPIDIDKVKAYIIENYETLDEFSINGKTMSLRKVIKIINNREETYYKIIIENENKFILRSKKIYNFKKAQKYFNRKKVKGELHEQK